MITEVMNLKEEGIGCTLICRNGSFIYRTDLSLVADSSEVMAFKKQDYNNILVYFINGKRLPRDKPIQSDIFILGDQK